MKHITQTITHALAQKNRQLTMSLGFIGLIALAMFAKVAIAGTSGDEFEELYNLLLGWAEGFLARAIVGIVFAVILAIGPSVINGIVSAVI